MAHIQLGNQIIPAAEALTLLAEYRLLSNFQRQFIINQAIADIELTPEEKTVGVRTFYQRNKLTTQQAIAIKLQQLCITETELEAIATIETKLEKFKIAKWGKENHLEQCFLKYKSRLDKVVYSIVTTDNNKLVQELFFRIQDGEATFTDCAREYSRGEKIYNGEFIGPVLLSQLHPDIVQKLSTSKPGQLLPPIPLEHLHAIVRLEKWIPAQLDDNATQTMLINYLFDEWVAEQIKNTPISINIDNSLPIHVLIPTTVTQ